MFYETVREFLYGDAINPFRSGAQGNRPETGTGILKDPFMPDRERPNISLRALIRLGIITKKD
jgi:hypothetical protein